MQKRRIGWILAISMVFTQNTGVWAEEIPEQFLPEPPVYGENIKMPDKDYTDRFIVKYKEAEIFDKKNGPQLEAAAKTAYSTALEVRRYQEQTAVQETVENSQFLDVPKFHAEERADVLAEAWKPGYALINLEEKVDPDSFIAELKTNMAVEYIQPDYVMELAGEGITLELVEIVEEPPGEAETINPAEQPAQPGGEGAVPKEKEGQETVPPESVQPEETGNPEPEETSEPAQTPLPETSEKPDETARPTVQPAGRAVTVAVIDGGVDVTHNVFAEKIQDAWDFTKDTALTYDENRKEDYYHGTHVAGIIAQTAPNAKIMPLKVFDQGRAYTSDIIDAIAYAREHGAEIVNCSWGGGDENPMLKTAMEESGMLFICAAGNSRRDLDESPVYPACFAIGNVLSVASLNPDQGFSYFSNYGSRSVEIAAPGRDIESAWPGNGYGRMSGTSMASGVVAGGAAVAAGLGEEAIKERILDTADSLSNLNQKVQNSRALNLSNLEKNLPGAERTVNPADDFDVHGYQPTPAQSWEQFYSLDNMQVAAGEDYTLVLKADGTVWGIGNNTNGQLGVNNPPASPKDRAEIAQVPGLIGIAAIAAGPGYVLALKNDGTVYAWGDNAYGQLGNGTKTETYVPAQIAGLSNVVKISAGRLHGLAITEDGRLYIWGNNNRGQLGDGTNEEHLAPVQITGLPTVYEAAAGGSHTAAITANGVYTWGYNDYGQLGDGTVVKRNRPVKISLSDQFKSIAAGLNFTAAIAENGRVYTWGLNDDGQLGRIGTNRTPGVVQELSNVKTISAGEAFCAAVAEDGAVYTWGNNGFGQLGDGTKITRQAPAQVMELPAAKKIAAGKYHVAAITETDDYIYTWGGNSHFQIGIGKRNEEAPVGVVGIENAVAVDAGMYHSIALCGDGTVLSWGYNNFGQLGNDTQISSDEPGIVVGLSDICAISAGGYHNLAVDNAGNVYGWGYGGYGQMAGWGTITTARKFNGLPAVRAVAAGAYHSMALAEDGTVYTWGRNEQGQLGNGTTTGTSSPKQIPGLTDVKAIAAGYYTSFAVKEDGTVYAWGANANNQLNTQDYDRRLIPTKSDYIQDVEMISAGPYHTLALQEGGLLYTWGNNNKAQRGGVGIGQYVAGPYSTTNLDVDAGEYHSVLLENDGTVTVFGVNTQGELGNGTLDKNYPNKVKDVTDAVDVAFGYGHGLAVLAGGRIVAWGNNGSGQLGHGARLTCKTPQRIGEELSDTGGGTDIDAREIPDNATFASVLSQAGGSDWYTFVAEDSKKYAIYTTGDTDTYGELYTEIGIAGGSPAAACNDYGADRNFKIIRDLSARRRYYVRVRGNTSSDLGEYTLHIEQAALNNSRNIISLTAEADKIVTVSATAKNVASLTDLAFCLTYDPEKLLAVNLTAQNFTKRTQPGRDGNVEIQSVSPGFIQFRLADMPEIETGQVWNGVLNLFQFRFLGETGETTEIQIDYVQGGGQ